MENTRCSIHGTIRVIGITLFCVLVLFESCANPVPPSGGDKDTTAPVLKSIGSANKDGQHTITIEFDENITTKGTILYSPISVKKQAVFESHVIVKRSELIVTIPSYANCLYLDNWVVDLNEKNPLKGNTLLFSRDSGEVNLKLNASKGKFGVYIQKDSMLYLPQNKGNQQYHFEGLPNSIHETYIIENDNNQQIENNESYNVFYSANRPKDTFFIDLYPPRKIFKGAYYLKNTNQFCVVGSAVTHEWLQQIDSLVLIADTLFIPYSIKGSVQHDLQIDSFIATSKKINSKITRTFGVLDGDTLESNLGIYGFNHPNYFKRYKTDKSIDTVKHTYIGLSKNTITNTNDVSVMIRISNKQFNYIVHIEANSSVDVILTEGSYDWTTWINGNHSNNQLLNIEGYDFTQLKPLQDPENFYVGKKPWIIKKNLNNTLILPEKRLYNTGITTN